MAVDNKKSKMSIIEDNQTICQIIKTFYYLGIWQNEEDSSIWKAGKKFCFVVIVLFLLVFIAANAFLCDDKDESIFSVQFAVLTVVIFVKCLYLVLKRHKILEVLYDSVVTHLIEDHKEYERVNKVIMKLMKVTRGYVIMIALSAILNVLIQLPIFTADKALPGFISFSWQNSEIIYWLAYALISFGYFYCFIANLMNILVWYIMYNYCIKYRVLGNKLRNLGWETAGMKKNPGNPKILKLIQEDLFIENIIGLIEEHQSLTETVERFRSCFSSLFLAQITTSGINICISIFNLAYCSSDEYIVQTQLYAATLIYGVFDIFLAMYLANEITESNNRLSYCLFECNWHDQTKKAKKYVIIMGEALKRPQQLLILIYPMNLETFTRIIKGAYSMFNILKNFK